MVWINKVNQVVIDDWSDQVKTFWLKKLLTFVVLCSEYSRVHKLVDKTSWSFCTSAEKAGVGQVPAPLDGTVLGGLHARDDPARLLGRDVVHCLLVTTSSKRTEREVSYAKKSYCHNFDRHCPGILKIWSRNVFVNISKYLIAKIIRYNQFTKTE